MSKQHNALAILVFIFFRVNKIAYGRCNFGLYLNVYPLADGKCSNYFGPGYGSSFRLDCGKKNATYREWDNAYCEGTPINATDVDIFECDNVGACNLVTYTGAIYEQTMDCTGITNESFGLTYYFAKLTQQCVNYGNTGAYLDITTNSEGMFVDIYDNEDCDGDMIWSFNYTDECDEYFTHGNYSSGYDFNTDNGGNNSKIPLVAWLNILAIACLLHSVI